MSNRVYEYLPVSLQNVAVSLYGLHWQRRRFGGVFDKELRGFKDREEFTSDQWRDYQTVELRRLLCHSFETVPYYRRVYSEAGFRADDFKKFELSDLKRLPFVEKEDLRAFGRSELVSTRPEAGGSFFASSGSTGTPTSILYSRAFHQRWSAAFEARIRHWAGLNRYMARGMVGGRRIIQSGTAPPPYYRHNWFEKQTYFSAYHISPGTASDYLKGIQRNNVEYMTGYALSNFFLARMLKDLSLQAPELRAVVVSSEKLTQAMRDVFREVYGCRTYDSYSGIEACGLISENASGELLSSPDVGILEVLDEEGNGVGLGEYGEVVSTGLLNFDQPLIRYRIGDTVKLASKDCSKSGLTMPVIDEISGRIQDKVVGPDGREMAYFSSVFLNVEHLLAAQVVQEECDWIRINAVATEKFGKSGERIITKRIRSQLGDVRVTVDRVSELPRNASGKVPLVISNIGSK